MTLHWWMHWFWITHLHMCCCKELASSVDSYTLNVKSAINVANLNKSTVILEKSNADNDNVRVSTKGNVTVNTSSILKTASPLVKESATMERNITEATINALENQTLATNVNHTENFLYTGETFERNLSSNFGCTDSQLQNADDQGDGSEGISIAGITGITLGCICIIGVISVVSFIIYRNYGLNRPQVLNDRFSNPDSSGYIDDSTVHENSEEMYSLDNDSFLNSLEAMTIQNLWTDTVKHTKL